MKNKLNHKENKPSKIPFNNFDSSILSYEREYEYKNLINKLAFGLTQGSNLESDIKTSKASSSCSIDIRQTLIQNETLYQAQRVFLNEGIHACEDMLDLLQNEIYEENNLSKLAQHVGVEEKIKAIETQKELVSILKTTLEEYISPK